ncbi:hypothetical protein AT00_16640 [Pseudoalteromonas lipolytica SCSIO 04301]|uniref:AAA+ ATPase domain-containing protein n=1 Tax=Pseudoalteromonas lipolytica TaxID=570156 RepID=A0ABY1GNB4_9GAMM|nr:hypothetical protein [Pseudoalteromonas lipolytica]EWH05011.1 hypothetical protein AT00_16640 [Pseudoalteromonas lipolytica SCSIO 04301]MBE0349735.1 hypothetical protein [Pseudoalteromonas lipolytica LMEB 39]SFT83220.1 hypothetical protein SAMN04487854_11170 [Pseudoalteromonas lipolytica]
MNHLTLLPYTTVQISKGPIYLGSAVLVKVRNAFYVLSSAHVTFGEGCEQYNDELCSTLTYKAESEKIENLTFIKMLGNLEIFKTYDIIAIEVDVALNNEGFPEIFFTIDTDKPELEFIFKGRVKSESGKTYSISPCTKNSTGGTDIHLEIPAKFYTDFKGETGAEVLQGLSGSGVFIHDNNSDKAFLTSIVKSVSDDNFVGVNCTCISLYKEHLIPEIELIDYEKYAIEDNANYHIKEKCTSTNVEVEELTRSILQSLQSQLMPSSLSGNTDIALSHMSPLSLIESVPLPTAIATRQKLIDGTVYSLENNNTAWLFGAAGVGKTVAAKVAAKKIGGSWVSVNLRGLNSKEVSQILVSSLADLQHREITGILIDDFDCDHTPMIHERLLNLHGFCIKSNVFILFTSSKSIDVDFLSSANLLHEVEQKVDDFSEEDIKEILLALDVTEDYWARYIYLSTGGGHPQLVTAMIHSMKTSNWSIEEFWTLNSLLQKNDSVEKVKKKTRERLLHELSPSARGLVERISLITGKFDRNLVLDLALVSPKVTDAGITFDQLIGAWVDQHEGNRFSLSPLLSNFAAATLTKQQQKKFQCEIADSILRARVIDPITMNSAFFAAFAGENARALTLLSCLIITSELSDLQIIAPHLIMFTFFNSEQLIFEQDLNVNIMLRGSQLLLLACLEDKKESYLEAFERFEIEADMADVQKSGSAVLVRILIYSKLLMSRPKFGNLPNWELTVTKLDSLFKNKADLLPSSIPHKEIPIEVDGNPSISIFIMNQISQIKKIEELVTLFKFIDSCDVETRDDLFRTITKIDSDIDALVRGAWLSEYDNCTIDCEKHSAIFAELECFANSWGNDDLATTCVKFSAVIWDETGNNYDKALELIEAGLRKYGSLNNCLLRAKALVLYHKKDYGVSLEISKKLLDGKQSNLQKGDEVFFLRRAAICAEYEGDYTLAYQYFQQGVDFLDKVNQSESLPMKIGLQADSAIVFWHAGKRKESLQKLAALFELLESIDPKSSLNAAHCHAVSRHILLWLLQEAKEQKQFLNDGGDVVIFPGIVSNPDPSKDITKHVLAPIELAWYMLASIENYCLIDAGISLKLDEHLPNGTIVDGDWILSSSKLDKSIIEPSGKSLVNALKHFVPHLSLVIDEGNREKSVDINFTYQTLPEATNDDFIKHSGIIENYILAFVTSCALQTKWDEVDRFVKYLSMESVMYIRDELISILKGRNIEATDPLINNTKLIMSFKYQHQRTPIDFIRGTFYCTLISVQVGMELKQSDLISKLAFESLKNKWLAFVRVGGGSLEKLALHFSNIDKALSVNDYFWTKNVLYLLKAILPTLSFANEDEFKSKLDLLIWKQVNRNN